MTKSKGLLLFILFLAPGLLSAAGPDIIYVDGKPVYIEGIGTPGQNTRITKTTTTTTTTTTTKASAAAQEAARSNIPGDIYRGTVLGQPNGTQQNDIYRGNLLGEKAPTNTQGQNMYRGTVFGQQQKQYASDSLGNKELAKTKYVYDTSLVRAIKAGDADRVRTLIYANVDVNQRNYAGFTPLTMAAEKGNLDIVRLLVEQGGASVNMPSSYGITPLIAAAAGGKVQRPG